jgi:4-hydroxythreonine-4-phosphate dehydrogenase
MKKNIAITYGDPKGIGPEVLNYILQSDLLDSLKQHANFTVIGDPYLFSHEVQNDFDFLVPSYLPHSQGEHSFRCLELAAMESLEGSFTGLVTGPISKAHWNAEGFHWTGQTEYLQEVSKKKAEMLFVTTCESPLIVMLLTRHVPLKDVVSLITLERMSEATSTLKKFLHEKYNLSHPKIAMASINPHAGDDGTIGNEEKEYLNEWIKGLSLIGTFSPDDIWFRSGRAYLEGTKQPFDAYIVPYHDQVLPLIKTITNFMAVNVSAGLPFIRTSPDHGTAFSLVGSGRADWRPFFEAIRLCVELS